MRHGVDVGIRRRVIRLPRRPDERRARREYDEEVQIGRSRQTIEQPGAAHFRRHHFCEPAPRLLNHHAIVEHSGGVHDAAERMTARIDIDEHPPHLYLEIVKTNVTTNDADVHSGSSQGVQCFLR
jgi:hypothetical protein